VEFIVIWIERDQSATTTQVFVVELLTATQGDRFTAITDLVVKFSELVFCVVLY
jgi:hypothetical protein